AAKGREASVQDRCPPWPHPKEEASPFRAGSPQPGTHVDAPLHFIPGGDSVDRVSPARLVVPADLVDLTSKGPGQPITRDDLAGRLTAPALNDGGAAPTGAFPSPFRAPTDAASPLQAPPSASGRRGLTAC
ncbi:MAG: cyclase family protein, partial [Acidilobus sp.]|nr:cyclase family protein [Acidilobus sp.]